MSYYADESDVYREPEAFVPKPHVEAIVREYYDARAALAALTPTTDRTQRWMTLDRYNQALMRMGVMRDAVAYDPICGPIIAAIRAEQAHRGAA